MKEQKIMKSQELKSQELQRVQQLWAKYNVDKSIANRNDTIEYYLPLATSISKRISRKYRSPFEDCLSVATEQLIRSVELCEVNGDVESIERAQRYLGTCVYLATLRSLKASRMFGYFADVKVYGLQSLDANGQIEKISVQNYSYDKLDGEYVRKTVDDNTSRKEKKMLWNSINKDVKQKKLHALDLDIEYNVYNLRIRNLIKKLRLLFKEDNYVREV